MSLLDFKFSSFLIRFIRLFVTFDVSFELFPRASYSPDGIVLLLFSFLFAKDLTLMRRRSPAVVAVVVGVTVVNLSVVVVVVTPNFD